MKPVTIGVIGYGHYVRTNFIKHLKACSSLNIVGVYNRGEERRKQAEQDGYWATSSLDELLAIPELESVFIGTANAAHKEEAVQAARSGKHIFCEKPMALTLKDIDAMVAAAEKAGVVTHVNHGSPYGEGFIKFRGLCETEGGRLIHVWRRISRQFGLWVQGARHGAVAHPEASGGWTFHHLCHQLNEACLLLGTSRATKVYHVMHRSCEEAPSEEIVNAFVTFDTGATAHLADGTSIGPFNDMGAQGTKADLRMLNGTITLVKTGPPDPTQRPGNLSGIVQTYKIADTGKNTEKVGDLFAQAVRGGKNELLSFPFIRDQYKILTAMKKSAQTGRVVPLT
jgi:predicted dehydrogenase